MNNLWYSNVTDHGTHKQFLQFEVCLIKKNSLYLELNLTTANPKSTL
jgi:hypothetical protein